MSAQLLRTFHPHRRGLGYGKELDQVTHILTELVTTSWHHLLLTNKDLLDFPLHNIHIHWKT